MADPASASARAVDELTDVALPHLPLTDVDRVEDELLRELPVVVAMWSPCCGLVRAGGHWQPGTMHNGACRDRHAGVLGPTVRLVAHPEDRGSL